MTVSDVCVVGYADDEIKFRRLFRWLCEQKCHVVDPIPDTRTIIIARKREHRGHVAVPMTDFRITCVCVSLQTYKITGLINALAVLATNELVIGFTPIVLPELIPDTATVASVPMDVCADTSTLFYSLKVGK